VTNSFPCTPLKGIKFSAAEDGQQAVDLFNAAGGSFNLMFLDVQMPIKVCSSRFSLSIAV